MFWGWPRLAAVSERRRIGRGGGEECLELKQPMMDELIVRKFPGGVRIDPGRVNGSNAGRTIPALDHKETKIKGKEQKTKGNKYLDVR